MKVKNITRIFQMTSVWMLVWVSSVHATAVLPMSSGVKALYYSLEWCSPQYSRLGTGISGFPQPCMLGKFQSVGGVAKVEYNGKTYLAGNVDPTSLGLPGNTRTSTPISSTESATNMNTLMSFLNSSTNGDFAIEGEGVLTIRAFLSDYADNISYFLVRYKIDKTAPQLSFKDITASPNYTYYGGQVGINSNITKNDSNTALSSVDALNGFTNPLISDYFADSAAPRSLHQRTKLGAFYFQNTLSGSGANAPFTVNTNYSDTYGTYLAATAASPLSDGYNGSLVAGEKHFQLLTQAGSPTSLTSNKPGLSADFSTADLSDNGDTTGQNTQKTYRLRLYDNTVGPDSSVDSGNYSETAFYAVRDNTAPNMKNGDLASTEKKAAESLLKFPDTLSPDTVYDTTTAGYNPLSSGFSRFLAANSAQDIVYHLDDVGVGGADANTYPLYNAGIDTSNTKIRIESASDKNSYPDFLTFLRFVTDGTKAKDFSNVDADTVSNGTYREYGSQFVSSLGNGMICDLVGNCIHPNLTFRVTAGSLNKTQSTLALNANTQNTSGKMFANGSDSYKLSYSLRDQYGNKIVPVQSLENNNAMIKTVSTNMAFTNGLNTDQRTNSPTGAKLVLATDTETDNATSTSNINDFIAPTFAMSEGVNNPNGTYTLSIASKVPTNELYPYLSPASLLRLDSISATANATPLATNITYPKTNGIGSFAMDSTSINGTTSLINPDLGGLNEAGGTKDITVDTAKYGNVAFASNVGVPFSSFNTRKLNLAFASPFLYGMKNMTPASLNNQSWVSHTKQVLNLSNLGDSAYDVYERYLVAYTGSQDEQPGVLNFTTRMNGGSTIKNIDNGAQYPNNNSVITNMFSNNPATSVSFDLVSKPIVDVMMSSLPGVTYDNSKIKKWYASALTYKIGSDVISLPSVGRDINDTFGARLSDFDMSRNYFSNTYSLGASTSPVVQVSAKTIDQIAITGLSNRYNSITTDTGGTKANINVSAELSRTDLVANIKKNISLLSAGLASKDDTSGQKKWCSATTIDQAFLNGSSALSCTQVVNGESISFIDGNATLDCGSGLNCHVSNKRSIIVKNGSIYFKSNITTLDSSWNQTDGQFFIGVTSEAGLANVSIDPNNPNITGTDKQGWGFVDPSITNLDAFIFTQGPLVSYSAATNVLYSNALPVTSVQLNNQLHVMGSLLTLNTIGGKSNMTCPYIVPGASCDADTASIFDLILMRRYKLVSKSKFTNLPADNNIFTPDHPNGINIAKKSGGTTGDEPTINPVPCGSNELRCIADQDYRPYRMLIERDLRWNTNPSELFKVQ